MINTEDQEALFMLIANYLKEDLTCIAIGGTAMMFAKYKTTTKDIDLIFKTVEQRNIFISAIEQLGYKQQGIGTTYDLKRKEHAGKPVMYTRGDERFDLFVDNVFGYQLSFTQDVIVQRVDFLGEKELTLHIFPPEELILLKAITGRARDYEDIETILEIEKTIDWNAIVHKAINQDNSWILIDLEETLQQLKKKHFIKQEVFEKIYLAQDGTDVNNLDR